MEEIIEFLKDLDQNNCREWFMANKGRYAECKKRFDAFVQQLIDGIREFDSSIGDVTVAQSTYRIYRDTRFSQDKTPYKNHMGAFIVPGGKKSGYSGYYVQVGPYETGYPGGCFLGAGNYWMEPAVLKLLREDIALDGGEEFKEVLTEAEGFVLDWSQSLKRVPNGYDAAAPYAEWLKLKNFCLDKEVGTAYMMDQSVPLVDRIVGDLSKTARFVEFINRAIRYNSER